MRRPYSSSTLTTDEPHPPEHASLGREVGLHRLVEVEVVLREIGEDPAREADPGRTPELQGVGGHLHRAGAVARVEHSPKRRLEVDRLGRRALHLLLHSPDHAFDRSEQAAAPAACLEQVADQEGGGGLAVRAGDADHFELRGRIPVEARRNGSHGRADVVDDQLRHSQPEPALAYERDRSALDRIGGEIVAVGPKAGHAKKERPWRDALARVGEARYLDLGGPRRYIPHQGVEKHGGTLRINRGVVASLHQALTFLAKRPIPNT